MAPSGSTSTNGAATFLRASCPAWLRKYRSSGSTPLANELRLWCGPRASTRSDAPAAVGTGLCAGDFAVAAHRVAQAIVDGLRVQQRIDECLTVADRELELLMLLDRPPG